MGLGIGAPHLTNSIPLTCTATPMSNFSQAFSLPADKHCVFESPSVHAHSTRASFETVMYL